MTTQALHTARLALEPWTEDHTALLVNLASDPRVTQYILTGDIWSRDRAEQVAAAQRDHWKRHGFGWRAALLKETRKPIGFIALNFAGEGTRGLAPDEYEIGWWLDPDHWGQGLAREGAKAVRDHALTELDAPSIGARIQAENTASLSVARALGLSLESQTTGTAGEPLEIHRLVQGTGGEAAVEL